MEQRNIRNFAIIAHVDHGKSTLSDRLLEVTKTIPKEKLQEQFLDQNPISRERGITIKLAPVRMMYSFEGEDYMLNLIDTPGHVDFSYEVSRTLAACDGAVLLVDATQGVQAQTVAHFQEAKKQNLMIIPVINKVDLPNAQVDVTVQELYDFFGFQKEEIIHISAKTGLNVEELLHVMIKRLPPPKESTQDNLRALIFDAVYDEYRGVVAYVRVIEGEVKLGDMIRLFQENVTTTVTEVGYFTPFLQKSDTLSKGEIGYIITGIKDLRKVRVGDTVMQNSHIVSPLPGYTTPQPMVFFGVYPQNQNDLVHLKESLAKLTLNDTALTYSNEYSNYLGTGFRVGFLGLLHAEIVKQRLKQEFNLDLLFTIPQVLYEKNEEEEIKEPYMRLIIYVPAIYVGSVMTLCQKKKGEMKNMSYHDKLAVLEYEMPYTMFIRGLSGELKSVSSGFASIDYQLIDFRYADLQNLEIRINNEPIDVLSELVYKDEGVFKAREKTGKLKETLPRQQFRQIIQGMLQGVIVSREEIPPFRKDVLAKMSGGDRTRKDKLLEAQKKGKKRMIHSGKVELPQEALFSMIENK